MSSARSLPSGLGRRSGIPPLPALARRGPRHWPRRPRPVGHVCGRAQPRPWPLLRRMPKAGLGPDGPSGNRILHGRDGELFLAWRAGEGRHRLHCGCQFLESLMVRKRNRVHDREWSQRSLSQLPAAIFCQPSRKKTYHVFLTRSMAIDSDYGPDQRFGDGQRRRAFPCSWAEPYWRGNDFCLEPKPICPIPPHRWNGLCRRPRGSLKIGAWKTGQDEPVFQVLSPF